MVMEMHVVRTVDWLHEREPNDDDVGGKGHGERLRAAPSSS